ncbi:MAG: Carboxylic ester hydrolase, partial [Humibacillus sp.]|nr:Carboxylic ester hydrolase [Humibacillus sp.]
TDVRDASAFGSPCVQLSRDTTGGGGLSQLAGSSEDCLFLNVMRPDDDAHDLPVVVYLHGGGFFAGSGDVALSVGGPLVRRGVVLVTLNYRLDRLGFFAHPALEQGVADFGLLDQVAALEWVRANAAAFGGDAGNVTLAGSSAGAMSVDALMAAPLAQGLFQRAISQSAPGDEQSSSLVAARQRGAAAFPGLSSTELRALPADDLLSTTFPTLAGAAPILDDVLPEPSVQAFASGTEAAVPFLVGTTADELPDLGYQALGLDPAALRGALGGAHHRLLVAAYGDDYAADVLDDLVFDLPTVERAMTHARRAPTFRYVFGDPGHAGHGAEAPYVFDAMTGGSEGRLSDAVADYWVAFARTGRPDVAGLPPWPEVGTGDGTSYLWFRPDGPTPVASDPDRRRLGVLRLAVS